MSTIPTNAAFKKITSNNITDDYIQLIRGSDKTVLLWVDALGVIHAPNSFLTEPGGATTNVQINNGGLFYGDGNFIYNPITQAVGIVGTLGIASAIGNVFTVGASGNTALSNPIAATSLANQSSPFLSLSGTYWNGSASAANTWKLQDVTSAGSNPIRTLTLTGGASSGGQLFRIFAPVAFTVDANANFGAAVIAQGTIFTAASVNGFVAQNTTAATSLANVNSANIQLQGMYWTGSASASDSWAIRDVLGTGSNPTSTFAIVHSGTSGVASVSVPALTIPGSSSGSALIGVAAAAGTPNPLLLPTTTGTNGQVLTTDGGSPQQLSWTTVSGGTPSLDQVTNPVANKTFTLGANSLTFSGAAGITLADSSTSSIHINATNTNGGVYLDDSGSGGSINLTDNIGTGIYLQSGTFSSGSNSGNQQIDLSINTQTISNSPQIVLNTSGIALTNSQTGGTSITDSGGGGITVKDSTVGHGNVLIYSVHSTAGDLGAYIEDDGAIGVTLDASNGTGPVTFLTNTTGGLKVKRGAGALTAGLNTALSGGIQTLTTIEGIVTAATATSDERLKTNIQPFTRGLEAVVAINPKTFQWNEAGQKYTNLPADLVQAGFIAQDVQKAIPEAIGHEGDYLSIDNRTLLAALINAVKELHAENSKLTNRLLALENK